MVRAPEMESLFRTEIDELNKSITEATRRKRAVEEVKFEQLAEKFPGFEGAGPGGLF